MTSNSVEPCKSTWASWLTSPFVAVQGSPETVTVTDTVTDVSSQQTAESNPEQASAQEAPELTPELTPSQMPTVTQDGAEEQSSEPLPMGGTWQKDEAASDAEPYAQQIAMLHMSSLYTYAALHYMWGVEITVNDQGHPSKPPSPKQVFPLLCMPLSLMQ